MPPADFTHSIQRPLLGSDIANAASVMVYLRNASDFAAMNEVYSTFWPKDPPARTTVVVTHDMRTARRVGQRAARQEPEAHRTVPPHASERPGCARDFDLAAEPRITKGVDDSDAIRRVTAVRDSDPQTRKGPVDFGSRMRRSSSPDPR